MDSVVRDRLRSAIHTALETVAPPIDDVIDAIILPYATDRTTIRRYYQDLSNQINNEINRLSKQAKQAAAIATMVRYPSFVSDAWLDSVRTGTPNVVMYESIDYVSQNADYPYSNVEVRINGYRRTRFVGCPAASSFVIFDELSQKISRPIMAWLTQTIGAETAAVLNRFTCTGRITVDDVTSASAGVYLRILPVVHAYFRLERLVLRGVCLNAYVVCDGCRMNHPAAILAKSATIKPFPAELYDDDD